MDFDFNKNINEELISKDLYQALLKYRAEQGDDQGVQDLKNTYGHLYGYDIQSKSKEEIPQQNINQDQEEIKDYSNISILDALPDDDKFRLIMKNIAVIHDKILDLYQMSLYEEDWDKAKIEEFENLLQEYNKNIESAKSMIPSIQWNSEKNKKEFNSMFYEVLADDAEQWNRVYARHNNYKRYRANRKTIILQINDIIDGGLKNQGDKPLLDIFKYFNNKCANVKLYNSTLTSKELNLSFKTWLKPRLNSIMDDLKELGISIRAIDSKDLADVFKRYVKSRKLAYDIFNLMTSNSEFNGYEKWHNKFIDYCDATLTDKQLEQLIYAVDSENQFEEIDDYQNLMDERAWERQGLYESWFDDELLDYQRAKKDKSHIKKINMVPTNVNQCKILCDGTNVYANDTFYPGDIIEICPTKTIDKSSLYSGDMRDAVFEVVPNKEWVLPYGYCKFYLSNDLSGNDDNCTYIWDPIKRVIVIKANKKIDKFDKLKMLVQID